MNKQLIIYLALAVLLFSCKLKKNQQTESTENTPTEQVNSKGKIDLNALEGDYYITFLESVPDLNEVIPTVKIQETGKIGGFNGCNSFFGQINSEEDQLIKKIGATRRACQGEGAEIERMMLETLKGITDIKREGNLIHFYKGENVVMRGKIISLEGGSWQVVSIEGGEYEQMPSFEVTNSRMNGATGCNSFFGMVEQNGFKLKILEPGMTEMACEGFDMSMEAKFMALLSQITHYKQVGEIAIFFNQEEELFRATNPEQE